ncbi:S-layer homology domain-containing protein [Paenibacillus sp. UNC496MF]|uniref:S-layer homology domain-containing protein n=1 Tax=Paenibacillus sp. UNC496MF TaxID=1502753 RepID=UPI0008EFC9A0|nr:S-layer homology domain-containing protein [Paenibacillus sp. UNC496MF]SFJ68710.1 S-layer homology domain-containing protein [Paenibacillus sp. UNC496MF]
MIKKAVSMALVPAMLLGALSLGAGTAAYAAEGSAAHSLKVSMNGKWANFSQDARVTANSSYQASFWMKGSGTITFRIMRSDWNATIASQTFAATDEWKQYTIPALSTGSNETLLYSITDGASGGTAYIDDCFLGPAGGTNMLENPAFTDGMNEWTNDESQGPVFSLDDVQDHPSAPDAPGDALDANGLVDELGDIGKLYDHSADYGIDSSNPNVFAGDAGRLSRGAAGVGEEVYAVYKTDYDVHSLSADAFYWDQQPVRDIAVSVSADGASYAPVALSKADFGGSWRKVNFSNYALPEGVRYVKVALPPQLDGEQSWAVQLSRVVLNNSTAGVTANPPSGTLAGPTDIALTSETPDADIVYFTDANPAETPYTSPIHIEGYTKLYAYAKHAGKEVSYTNVFTYYTADEQKVDAYGQLKNADFASKVTSDRQLLDDNAADDAYYGSLQSPERDSYGGLPGSKERYGLEAKGFFNIQKLDGKFVMVDPDGNLYFSVGVDGTGYTGDTFTQVKGREYEYQWLPDKDDPAYAGAFLNGNPDNFSFYVANKIKKAGGQPFNDADFYNESVERLKKWGFTSEGGFSNPPSADKLADPFPQVKFADLPSGDMIGGTGLFDVFKPTAAADIAQALADEGIAARKDDPLIIGYFFGNELPYQNFRSVFTAADASSANATKGALVDELQAKYGDIAAFNAAWETSFAGFGELRAAALPVTSEAASADLDTFLEHYLDKFYATITSEFRKVDPNHMMLGDRYLVNTMSNTDIREMISRVAGKYLDVLSYNYYTYDLDMNRIKTMSALANKPLLFTEFHYGEPTQGLTGGIRVLDNEREKGEAYRNYVEKAAASGVVVGAHWFEYLDQAATGRWFQGYNGESYGIGLLNVADRPYKTMLASVKETNDAIYDVILGNKPPYSFDFGPGRTERDSNNATDIPKASAPIVVDGVKDASWPSGQTLSLGDKDRVLGTQNAGVSADFNLAWDQDNLYIYAHVNDPTPMQNAYEGFDIWNGDALELFVGPEFLDKPGALRVSDSQVILSGTGGFYWYNNKDPQPPIDTVAKADADGKGYAVEAAIPLSGLNIADAADGRKMRFDIGFDNGEGNHRVAQYLWNGVDGNSSSRDKWGLAQLTDGAGSGSGGGIVVPADGTVVDAAAGVIKPAAPSLDAASGEATANVPASAFSQLPASADPVTIQVPKADGATGYVVNLPTDVLSSAKRGREIVVATDKGTITLPSDMLNGVDVHNAATVAIVIAAADASKLGDAAKAAIGGRPAVNVSLRSNGEELPWRNPDAPVTISIPYAPPAAEAANGERITVWYIGGDGQPQPVVQAAYDPASGSVSFGTTHFSTYAVVYVEKHFNDLERVAWAKNAIETLASKGAIEGVAADTFAPSAPVTRADYVQLLVKTLGLTAGADSADGNFADVKPGGYYGEAVGIAKALGIAAGGDDGLFRPQASVSREDMMTLTARALAKLGKLDASGAAAPLDRFADRADVSGYAAGSVSALLDAGLVQGADGKLNPRASATRAEAAVFLYNALRFSLQR